MIGDVLGTVSSLLRCWLAHYTVHRVLRVSHFFLRVGSNAVDNVCGAVIVAQQFARVHPVHLMNVA